MVMLKSRDFRKASDVASALHPIFVRKGWTYDPHFTGAYVPSVGEIYDMVVSLMRNAKDTPHFPKTAESGRILVWYDVDSDTFDVYLAHPEELR